MAQVFCFCYNRMFTHLDEKVRPIIVFLCALCFIVAVVLCSVIVRAFPAHMHWRTRPTPPLVTPLGKTLELTFCLLAEATNKSPKNELQLLQAGLGRRTVNIQENADHNEVCVCIFAMAH